MSIRIAIRIPDVALCDLDLGELRERQIAREYREAYGRHPDDPEIGQAGLELLAAFLEREESEPSEPDRS